jgi:hypothetical protein
MQITAPLKDQTPAIARDSRQAVEPDLQARIKAANARLAQLQVRTKEQSQLPSIANLIQTIKQEHQLPADIEMHFHKQKDPVSNEVMLDPVTQQALKIAEFVSKSHKCHEHQINALHQAPEQKKTPVCHGPHCKPVPSKPAGFFQSLFSIAD